MKNMIKNAVTVLGIALMLAISFYGWMAYETRLKVTYIGTEQSPEGETQVIFQMLGEPERKFLGSSGDGRDVTRGRVIVNRGGVEIKTVEFAIYNDGKPLSEDNWNVNFYPAGVEIMLAGEANDSIRNIVVYYDGSEGSGEDIGESGEPIYSEEEIIAEITARYGNEVSFLEEKDGRYYFQAEGFTFSAANDMQITDDYEESCYTYQVRRYAGTRFVELEKTVDESGAVQYEAVIVETYGRGAGVQESFCDACCDIVENTQALIGYRSIGYDRGGEKRYFELAPYLENYDRARLYNDIYLALEEDSLKTWQADRERAVGSGASSDTGEMPDEWKDGKADCAYRKKDGTELRMVAVDRAAGSSYYVLLQAENGINTSVVNWNPHLGSGGSAVWIDFLEDETTGFSCLAYNGGSFGALYRTQDGGKSFTEITWPSAKRELSDGSLYNPFVMPEKVWEEDGKLKMLVGQGPEGDYYEDGAWVYGLYESTDRGKNWTYLRVEEGKDTRP